MKVRVSRKQVTKAVEQFDMFDTKQAPVARGTMRACWDTWSSQYIPLRGTSPRVEFDLEVVS